MPLLNSFFNVPFQLVCQYKWTLGIKHSLDIFHGHAVNEGMGKKVMHKAMYESLALIAASVLQVYLLRRLFDRKLGISRV